MVLPGYIVEAARGGTVGDLETIRDWLDDGGDINDVDSGTNRTILMMGIVYEFVEVVKLAISRGADVNKDGESRANLRN